MGNRIRMRNSPDMLLEMILQFEFLSKSVLTRRQNAHMSSIYYKFIKDNNNQDSKVERSRVGLVISVRSYGGAGIACPGSDTPLVEHPLATDKGAIKCLISTATSIYELCLTADHPGRDSSLLGNRALNNSS
ncbi:hypothetical protein Tco_0210986 [Tanacetum coccineum]